MKLLLSLLLITGGTLNLQAQQKGYYRYPALHQNTLLFTAEGDIWKYDLSSGNTSRLTTHSGLETNPSISPDGKQVAFVGSYEGPQEIYIMNMSGGVPKRLTYESSGYYLQIQGWTKDGMILYRTDKFSQMPMPMLAKLNPATLHSSPLPLWQASHGSYDDAGNLYFTRFPHNGSRTKRYKGGLIEQVWKFDGKNEATNLTSAFEGTSASPMYYNKKIYFLSDRDGTMNLWSMDTDGRNEKQVSFSNGWDIQSPSMNQGRIAYQKGADIWMYDLQTGNEKMIDINLGSDFDQRKPRWIKSPVNNITSSDISPTGNYASIISRGRLFVSPSKSDRWVEVSRKSGVRFRDAQFYTNKSLAVLSDETGEYEVWSMDADGSGKPKQITKNSKTLITFFKISPDAKYIAYNDKNDVLRIADVSTGQIKYTVESSYGGNISINWSPDSRYLVYTLAIENLNAQIHALDMKTLKSRALTTERLDSYYPAWSSDGNWLYFISDRNLRTKVSSPWGSRQPEPYYTEVSNIYALPMHDDLSFPFIQSDSWMVDSLFTMKVPGDSSQDKTLSKKTKINKDYNWDHAVNSMYRVPTPSANISSMDIAADHIYWLVINPGEYGSGGKLYALKIKESQKYEPVEVASGVQGFSLSSDRKRILVNYANRNIGIADANGNKINAEDAKLILNNWAFQVNPQEDWKQMYDDAWRLMRDYFYDPNLHNVKWEAIRKQYEPLVARITDRYELDDLLSQTVGEIAALHTFVYGGDKRTSPDQIPVGFLGAMLSKNDKGYRIDRIFDYDRDYPELSSPLDKPNLKIKAGDIITEINNVPVLSTNHLSELLMNKVNSPVKLTLIGSNGKAYEQIVKPFSARDEANMKYNEWELRRRYMVDSASNNEIGYVHLKSMGSTDMDDFVKQYYPIFNRKGLILDVRHNTGGNIDSWVLEKLMRKAWMYWQARSGGPTWNMHYAFRGPMVILCDQASASDGEAIAEGFRRLGLGKVVGMRTWGGEIWLSSSNRLVDNGIATAAEIGVFGPENKWLIEGRGVEPDIVIDNLPYETFKGKDAQLEYAIQHLKKEIKANPVYEPKAPPYPDKSFDYKKVNRSEK